MARETISEQLDEALEDIASVKACLEDVYTPESTREELAEAVGKVLEIIEDYESEEQTEEEDDYETVND